MSANTGGPAFPVPADGATDGRTHDGGMTLLDWYAGQALAGLLSSPNLLSALIDESETDETPKPIAIKAYEMAEAMLAEKARREAVVQQSSTTDHSGDANKMVQDHSPDAGKMEELEARNMVLKSEVERLRTELFQFTDSHAKLTIANRELVEFAERLAAFPLEEFGWQSRKDSQPLHGWNDYTLYVSDIKRARNLVAKHKGAA